MHMRAHTQDRLQTALGDCNDIHTRLIQLQEATRAALLRTEREAP